MLIQADGRSSDLRGHPNLTVYPRRIWANLNSRADFAQGVRRVTKYRRSMLRAALMFNPDTAPYYDAYLRSFKSLPHKSTVDVTAAHARSAAEVERVIAELGRDARSGLIVAADPYIVAARGLILKAAAQHHVPVIAPYKQFVVEGGLMSYGPDTADIFRRSGSYVDRILKGESAGNLPAQSPDKFELVVNLKRAKALGLSVRESFLLLADEVIE